jgi:hypothetical protein
MTTTTWAVKNPRCLSQLLVKIARLSNEACDTLTRDTEPDKATFRDLGLRLVGRQDLTVQWDGLLSAVANFDEYQRDPIACETWTEDMIRDDVALAVWDLLHPGEFACLLCRALIGDGADDTPAAVFWAVEGHCEPHSNRQPVVPDPWQQKVA